jgi:hypothetical protein
MIRSLSRPGGLAIVFALLVAALATVFAAVQPATAQSSQGRVRVMHASPDAPAVDIFVDGAKAVTALAFPDNTGYVSLPAGPHNVKVFVSPSDGTGTPVLEANLNIAANTDYTVLAVGRVGDNSLALLPLQDNNAAPAAGNAHVRLIHASPDAPAVDVLVAGTTTKVFSNVAFKATGDYTPVPAGTYNLQVNAAGTDTKALDIPGVQLQARTVYTVVAVGLLGDQSLKVVPLVDAQPQPAPPAAGTGLTADGQSTTLPILALLAAAALIAAGGTLFLRSRAN